jgi:hypothetical protein
MPPSTLPKLTRSNFRFGFLLASVLMIGAIFLPGAPSEAKSMERRLGLGYRNQLSADLPSLALQYYPSSTLGLALTVGIDTQKQNSKFGATGRVMRMIFVEEANMNFYMGAAAGLLSAEVAGTTESGFELQGFSGVEFFLSGLENLGFNLEFGISVNSAASGVRFRTFGDSPLRAGITFYF